MCVSGDMVVPGDMGWNLWAGIYLYITIRAIHGTEQDGLWGLRVDSI